MDISGYDPRPEEKEKWKHFCHVEEKEMMVRKKIDAILWMMAM